MPLTRLVRSRLDVIESLCDLAVGIGDALHHQHAFVVAIRLGHTHAGGGQSVQRIDFGVLPGDFLFPPAVAAALAAHCTRITAAARLSSFLVFGQLVRSEEHTSERQLLKRTSYAVL